MMDEEIDTKFSKLKIIRNWAFAALLLVWVSHVLITNKYIDLGMEGWTKYASVEKNIPGFGHEVQALSFDDEGQLWVGTRSVMAVRSPEGEWTTVAYGDLGIRRQIQSLEVDNSGHVWVGTSDGLLVLNPEGNWIHHSSKETGIARDDIQIVAIDETSRIWVGTRYGVVGVRNLDGSWTKYQSNQVRERIRALSFDVAGRVWVGTSDRLAILAPDGSWTIHSLEEFGRVRDSVIDKDGRF